MRYAEALQLIGKFLSSYNSENPYEKIGLVIAQEAGDDFNREFRRKAARAGDLVFDVLTRSHARACQIASGVLSLLRSGHADGAIARWRSLHEVSVVSSFIAKQGHEVAERYLLHHCIESCKAARQFQCYHGRIGQEPFDPDQIAMMEKTRDNLIKRYGKNYGSDYGWACQALGRSNPKFTPNFSDIEKSVDLDHLRSYAARRNGLCRAPYAAHSG